MSIQILASGGTILVETDTNKNVFVISSLPSLSDGKERFVLSRGIEGAFIIAASQAVNTTLAGLYYMGGTNTVAYLKKFQFMLAGVTTTFTDQVPGAIGLQRFLSLGIYPTAIPTPNSQKSQSSIGSSMYSQSSHQAISLPNAIFGTDVAWARMPAFTGVVSTPYFEWVYEPVYPTVIYPNNGLALRIRVATSSWKTFVYTFIADFEESYLKR
jgi:hypothetical protein